MPCSSASPFLSLPPALRSQLRGLRRKLWRTRFFQWACLTLAGVLFAFVAVWLSDRFWETPAPARFGLILIVSAVALANLCWLAGQWGCRFRNWHALGRLVRAWNRRTGDRLLAALELTGSQGQALESPRLREAAMGQLTDQLTHVDLTPAVDSTSLRRYSKAFVGLTLLAGLLFLASPDAGLNAVQRCFLPWKPIERYTFVQLGSVPQTHLVAHGEVSVLRLPLKPDSPWKRGKASVQFETSGERLTTALENDHYTFTLPGVTAEENLHFTAGDARHQVRLIPKHRPGLEKLTATTTLPKYLQYPEQEHEITNGKIDAIPETRISLQGNISRPLATAELRATGIQPLSIDGKTFETIEALTITAQPQVIEIRWQDHLGLTAKDPLRIHLKPVEDRIPRVEISSSVPSPLALLAGDAVAFALRAEDDFGLKTIGLVTGTANENPDVLWETRGHVVKQGHPQATTLDADLTFSPQAIGLEPGVWQVWAYARDYRPDAPPAFSSPKTVQVLTEEQHASLMRSEFRQVQEQLESIARQEANLKHENETALAAAGPLEPEELTKQREAEEINAAALEKLTQQSQGLLEEAMKNPSLDTAALKPWSAMLGAMKGVAQGGMPGAAQSLAQAAAAAAQGDAGKAQAATRDAISQQEENLKQLAEAVGQGQTTEERLEAATFINRLRQAAADEEDVAATMQASVFQSAGLTPTELGRPERQALQTLASGHEHTREGVGYLMSDLQHYHRRTGKAVYGEVHRQMIGAAVPTELTEITQRVKSNQHGRVIQGALKWGKQFHAWADILAAGEDPGNEPPAAQEGSGESPGQADGEMMLAIMRLVQREMTLREQTRALDERKIAQEYPNSAERLAGEQRSIGFSVAGLLARALGPDLQIRLRASVNAINEAAALLDKPETGGETIAAETEVIELLADAAKTSGQMSGNSKAAEALAEVLAMMELGNSPGGNDSGGVSTLASRETNGATSQDDREERRVRQTTGFAAGDFPEEFRDALGHFFEKREQLRQEASAP